MCATGGLLGVWGFFDLICNIEVSQPYPGIVLRSDKSTQNYDVFIFLLRCLGYHIVGVLAACHHSSPVECMQVYFPKGPQTDWGR